jgi:hypothetical protein
MLVVRLSAVLGFLPIVQALGKKPAQQPSPTPRLSSTGLAALPSKACQTAAACCTFGGLRRHDFWPTARAGVLQNPLASPSSGAVYTQRCQRRGRLGAGRLVALGGSTLLVFFIGTLL